MGDEHLAEEVRESAGVAGPEDKLRDDRIRWYGHVQRREK